MLITSKEELLKVLEEKAVLIDAKVTGVDLSGIELKVYGFENCSFNESNLSGAYVKDCSFKSCEFLKTNLSKSVVSSSHFENCIFHESLFKQVEMEFSFFRKCDFERADFSHAKITRCEFDDVVFSKADMTGIVNPHGRVVKNFFYEADMSSANLSSSDLNGFSLIKVNLKGANLSGTRLTGALFKGVITTSRTKGLTTINLESVGTLEKVVTYVVEMDRVFIGCWEGTSREFYEKSEEVMEEKGQHFNLPIAIATIKEAVKLYGKGE